MELQEYKTYKRNPNQIITRANPHICYLKIHIFAKHAAYNATNFLPVRATYINTSMQLKIHIFARVISIQACSLQCNQLPTRQSNLYQYIYAAFNTIYAAFNTIYAACSVLA
jgi:hypothetical protein